MVHHHKLPSFIEAAVPITMEDIDTMAMTNEETQFLYEFFHDKPLPESSQDDDDQLPIADWVLLCGNLGVTTSMLVTLAPLPTLTEIWQTKSVGTLPLLPFTIMIIKAFMWFVYGALKSQRMLWVPNLVALPLAIVCFCVYTRYSPQESPQLPGKVSQHVFLIFALLAITTLSATILPPWVAVHAVGIQAVLICVIRDWSPLVRLADVLKRKNADAISAPMSIAGCFDCALWAIFGKLAMNDALVYVPNVVRFGFTGLQVVLIIMYGPCNRERTKKWLSHKRHDSDTFDGLLGDVESIDIGAGGDDDETVATMSTMSTAGSRSLQMQDIRKQRSNSEDVRHKMKEPSNNDMNAPVRHRHHELV